MRVADRRVMYTKMVLRESLLDILQSKPINRVSVTEICQTAELNRGTFYAHYQDPYALLAQIEDDLFHELEDAIIRNSESGDMDQMMRRIICVLSRNREVCRVILGENGNGQFIERILDMARTFFIKNVACKCAVPEGTADYIYRYLSAGSLDVVRHWLLNDDARSQDEVALIISSISRSIITSCMEQARTVSFAR